MDRFKVGAKDSEVLVKSHIVEEMKPQASEMVEFPVLLGSHVANFHSVDGGYHRHNGYHIIKLIHEVQGPGSPFGGDVRHANIEIHLDDYFWLEVADITEFDERYPKDDYVLMLKVTGYEHGPYAFSDELQSEVDNRETEYSL